MDEYQPKYIREKKKKKKKKKRQERPGPLFLLRGRYLYVCIIYKRDEDGDTQRVPCV